ncbi:MAG: PEP/pyruvate-binding domain-containing protein [Candidatus Micrarchaeota archaeon]|nr:PEP/pyruvate-binding domain-containing protein [Candidatus Micrarchaeota archaeon]
MQRVLELSKTRFPIRQDGKFTIVGEGIIGGKAQQLMEKQEAIERAGMKVPDTIVLATDFFETLHLNARRLAERNNVDREFDEADKLNVKVRRAATSSRMSRIIDDEINDGFAVTSEPTAEDVKKTIKNADIGEAENEFIVRLLETERSNVPSGYVVRSSQKDETGGTGQYFSGFSEPTGEEVIDMAKRVVASSGMPDMAVMIQPWIGEWFGEVFFPLVAGCGYSTRFRNSGEGKLAIVHGFGTKAVERRADIYIFGDEIRQTEIDPASFSIDYIDSGISAAMHGVSSILKKENHWTLTDGFDEAKKRAIELLQIALRKLEKEIGRSQYIEFAMDSKELWCIQIADNEPVENQKVDFNNQGVVACSGVVTSGFLDREFTDIVYFPLAAVDLTWLRAINEKLKDYVLVINSGALERFGDRREIVQNASNARVVIATVDTPGGVNTHHIDTVAGMHVRETFGNSKPFMVVENANILLSLETIEKRNDMARHIKRNVRVRIDEAVGRGQLILNE